MGEGFPFLDIVLFAMVAAFIILRLRGVLGRRPGNGQPNSNALSRRQQGDDDRPTRSAISATDKPASFWIMSRIRASTASSSWANFAHSFT